MPEYWVSLSLSVVKYIPTINAPSTKFGWIPRQLQKSEKVKDNMYISFVMKPSMPSAKCRMEVGNSYSAQMARKVLPTLTVTLMLMSNTMTRKRPNPVYRLRGPMKQQQRWIIPLTSSSLLMKQTLPKFKLVRMDRKQAMISMVPAKPILNWRDRLGLIIELALMKQLRLSTDQIPPTMNTLMRMELKLNRDMQEWWRCREDTSPSPIMSRYARILSLQRISSTSSVSAILLSLTSAIFIMTCRACSNSCLTTRKRGDSRVNWYAQQARMVRGIAVTMKITRHDDVIEAKMAMKIWPNAHPMDSTIGVDARDTSFITSDRLSKDALQNPRNPALKKNTPIEKMVTLPAKMLRQMPAVIMAMDSSTAQRRPLRSMTDPQQRLPMKPPYRKASKQILSMRLRAQVRLKVYATLRVRSERGYYYWQAVASSQAWPGGHSKRAGWKMMGKPIWMKAAKKNTPMKTRSILSWYLSLLPAFSSISSTVSRSYWFIRWCNDSLCIIDDIMYGLYTLKILWTIDIDDSRVYLIQTIPSHQKTSRHQTTSNINYHYFFFPLHSSYLKCASLLLLFVVFPDPTLDDQTAIHIQFHARPQQLHSSQALPHMHQAHRPI